MTIVYYCMYQINLNLLLVNVTPSSGLIGDPHGSLVLSQTEDDGLLLRPAGGKHARALEPPWFLVNSVDPWSTAWEFFFPSLLGMTSFQVTGGFPLYLQNYTGGINRRVPRHAESGPDRSWKQQRSQKKNLLYCMAWTTRSLHLCEFYLVNHEPQNCLKGTSPLIFGENMEEQQGIFFPKPNHGAKSATRGNAVQSGSTSGTTATLSFS